jgi:hypothetical protein
MGTEVSKLVVSESDSRWPSFKRHIKRKSKNYVVEILLPGIYTTTSDSGMMIQPDGQRAEISKRIQI